MKQNKEEMILEYKKFVALQDIPTLHISKGTIYQAYNASDEEFFKNNSRFEEWIDPKNRIKQGDWVSISGWWRESGGRNERLNKEVTGSIEKIAESTDRRYYISVATLGGEVYYAYLTTLDKNRLQAGVKEVSGGNSYIKPIKVYWFINSNGDVSMDFVGRHRQREYWLPIIGNYFSTKEEAVARKTQILQEVAKKQS